jgi:hypothetical protein
MEQDRPYQPRRARRPGEPPQTQYRLYFRHDTGDHFSRSHEFEANDDDHAVRIARSWLEGRRAELWCGTRRLKSCPDYS